MEDDVLGKISDLENKMNSMKEQILRITRLVDQDKQEKEKFIKQIDNEIRDLEDRINNHSQQEKQVKLFISKI